MALNVFFHPNTFLDLLALPPDRLAAWARTMDDRGAGAVLSRELLVQLLTASQDPHAGQRVAQAVMLLSADGLVLEEHLSWGMLATGGEDRRALASELRRQGRIAERLNRAIAETGFEALGLPGAMAQGAVRALLPLLKHLGSEVPEAPERPGPGLRAMGMRAADARRMGELLLNGDRIQAYQMTEDQLEQVHTLGDRHPLRVAAWEGLLFSDLAELLSQGS